MEKPATADSSPVPPTFNPDDIPASLRNHQKYRILRELGRGGMGVVYQAEHKIMGRLVAVKVINHALLTHPNVAQRFDREIKAAASLDHPNIAKAFDAERAGDLQLLVIEFVDGESLADYLVRKGTLPVAHACHYIRQAALGLQHAHEKGLVHRDLKPQNLMRTPKGVVKILDFGLAKLASEHRTDDRLTADGDAMGTPQYMPPEQWRDTKSADIRADIYSLGCSLFCLLTGRPPFLKRSKLEYMAAHALETPTPVDSLRPEVPPELASLIARMLAKEPAQRPQTPQEVAAALAPFTRPTGTTSAPPTIPPATTIPSQVSPARGSTTARRAPPLTTHPNRRLKLWLLSAAGVMMGLLLVFILAKFLWPDKQPTTPSDGQVPNSGNSKGKNPDNNSPAPVGLDLELWQKDRDRAVAQWAMGLGARVKVNGRDEWVPAIDKLPKTPFKLTHVDFHPVSNSIRDAELAYLSGTGIIDLTLKETKITDAGLEHIADLRLIFLDADGVRGITDVGAERIGRMRSLKWLYVNGTEISDKGLVHFEQLRNLEELQVKETRVTQERVEKLKSVYQKRGQRCRFEDDWSKPN
jgi:serine/threonine protein kinase